MDIDSEKRSELIIEVKERIRINNTFTFSLLFISKEWRHRNYKRIITTTNSLSLNLCRRMWGLEGSLGELEARVTTCRWVALGSIEDNLSLI